MMRKVANEMTVFSSVDAARQHGFLWHEWQQDVELHVVIRDFTRPDGRRVRALAFARPDEGC